MVHTAEIDLGNGRIISLETGKLAKQANGAVVVRSGESVVLVTACASDQPKPGASFFPLTVDYREYTYAAGRFPGGFIKREGRPSEREILTARSSVVQSAHCFPKATLLKRRSSAWFCLPILITILPLSRSSVLPQRWQSPIFPSRTCWVVSELAWSMASWS